MENLSATLLPIVQKINGYLADYVLIFLWLVPACGSPSRPVLFSATWARA